MAHVCCGSVPRTKYSVYTIDLKITAPVALIEAADANLDLTAEERGMISGLAREGVLRSVFCARRSDAVR